MAKKAAKKTAPEPAATPSALTVERVPLSELTFDTKNAKKHGERDLAVTGKSLDEFGQVEPLIVWQGTVIGGNGRLEAMRARGWTHADIHRVDHLTEAKARQLAIVLNRSSQIAGWDEEVLLAQLRELESQEVDLDAMGCDRAFLDSLASDAIEAADQVTAAIPSSGGGNGGGSRSGGSKGSGEVRTFRILITCRDEMHQQELLDRFEQEKLESCPANW